MGSADLFRALTRTLRGGNARAVRAEDLRLTPYLSVVTAVLYMMAADGEISDRESSQLQSVIGADAETLHRAVAYAETRSVEQFLQEVPPVLDAKSRLCLLMNVCDSLMADGELSDAELQLFDRLAAALGHTRASFQPYFDTIVLKDRTSVLGDFDAAARSPEMTPPKALVASLLYMMSADGSMGEEEIGRLNAVVGTSQGLLRASLRYVSQVRAPQFLAAAAGVLDAQQRLCILLNACDTMMSDHKVAGGERDLFRRMLAAFGIAPADFERYLNVIYLKNDLPQDERRVPSVHGQTDDLQTRGRSRGRSEGVVFERKRQWEEETGDAGDAGANGRRKARAADGPDAPASEVDARISRTMQDNIDRMSGEFDGGDAFDTLAANSRIGGAAVDGLAADEGPSDLRAFREAGFSQDKDHVHETGHAAAGQHWRDAEGDDELRATRDAGGPQSAGSRRDSGSRMPGRHWKDGDGDSDARAMHDGEGPQSADGRHDRGTRVPGRHWKDAGGDLDARAMRDADANDASMAGNARDGVFDKPALQDAAGAASAAAIKGDAAGNPGRAWRDATKSGDGRALQDADAVVPGTHLVDDRSSFDPEDGETADGPASSHPIAGRMGSVSERTRTIQEHLDAMRSARSIAAANRLPRLPAGPAVQRRLPAGAVGDGGRLRDGVALLAGSGGAISLSNPDVEDDSRMLLASDEGGPILNQNPTNTPAEQSRLNRQLRVWSGVLLPALFLTYGTTMVGEANAERSFITSENMATDARVVHQMASVQQTVYRVVPDSVTLAAQSLLAPISMAATTAIPAASAAAAIPAASAAVATPGSAPGATTSTTPASANTSTSTTASAPADGEAELPSDREQADRFLERRKQELMSLFQRHQGASAVAAERQQWFVYAKSIVLLGLGMTFWGVLFRSMRMLHGSTAAGLVGLLLTLNGYWLFMHI